MITKEVTVISENQTVVAATFDKNYQLCDIQPRMNLTLDALNTFKGRPYDLCREEVLNTLRQIVRSEEFEDYETNVGYEAAEDYYPEPDESTEEE